MDIRTAESLAMYPSQAELLLPDKSPVPAVCLLNLTVQSLYLQLSPFHELHLSICHQSVLLLLLLWLQCHFFMRISTVVETVGLSILYADDSAVGATQDGL